MLNQTCRTSPLAKRHSRDEVVKPCPPLSLSYSRELFYLATLENSSTHLSCHTAQWDAPVACGRKGKNRKDSEKDLNSWTKTSQPVHTQEERVKSALRHS